MQEKGLIYRALLPSGMCYIGQTVDLPTRIKQHYTHKKDGSLFHAALKYYNQKCDWLIVEDNVPIDMLNNREQYWIMYYDSFEMGYNTDKGGGYDRSDSFKQKISEAHKGKKVSEKTKNKISVACKGKCKGRVSPMKGRHHSEETKQKLSEVLKGRHLGKGSPMKGRHHSEESKNKMSDAARKRKRLPMSEETKAKIRQALQGHTVTAETRQRISKTMKTRRQE